MQWINRMSTAVRVQWALWIVVFLMLFFSMLPEDSFGQAAIFSLLNALFYAVVIYGNISWLYPRFYLKGRVVVYVITVLAFLIVTGLCRGFLLTWIYNTWYNPHPEPLTVKIMLRYLTGIPLLFVMSFIFRIAIVYFELKAQAAALVLQHAKTELNLLKSQVQPHFLFNTLNNIYYEAYREAPRTAALIERLSDMMRYFVEESPKDQVDITTEIQFLENYIALERIRIRHDVMLTFTHEIPGECSIPPMLLMTFTENIFKHGIDKTSQQNEVDLRLERRDGRLHFHARNSVPEQPLHQRPHGSGIDNLRKRLALLYGADYTLQTSQSGHYFTAFLSVPL